MQFFFSIQGSHGLLVYTINYVDSSGLTITNHRSVTLSCTTSPLESVGKQQMNYIMLRLTETEEMQQIGKYMYETSTAFHKPAHTHTYIQTHIFLMKSTAHEVALTITLLSFEDPGWDMQWPTH